MQIDVYDFDKTAVPYDSAMKYWYWCLLHRPYLILLSHNLRARVQTRVLPLRHVCEYKKNRCKILG